MEEEVYIKPLAEFFAIMGGTGASIAVSLQLLFIVLSFRWGWLDKFSDYCRVATWQFIKFTALSSGPISFYALGATGYKFHGWEGFGALMGWFVCYIFIELVMYLFYLINDDSGYDDYKHLIEKHGLKQS